MFNEGQLQQNICQLCALLYSDVSSFFTGSKCHSAKTIGFQITCTGNMNFNLDCESVTDVNC